MKKTFESTWVLNAIHLSDHKSLFLSLFNLTSNILVSILSVFLENLVKFDTLFLSEMTREFLSVDLQKTYTWIRYPFF